MSEAVRFLHAGGHRLEYRRIVGPASRPVLVFLHEGLGSTALWKDFPDAVAAATGCPALVYSRCGYGRSDPLQGPHAVDYMHREAREVLPQVLGALGIAEPFLVGHSDGASIALIHAGAGHAVRGVVAMAPHVFVEDLTVASIAEAKVAWTTTDLPRRLGRYHEHVESAFRGWNDIWLHPDFRAWNIESCLPRITCPVLVIQGEDDQYGTRAQVDAIAAQVPGGARVLLLPGCRHSPHVDCREAVIAAIATFA
jgi:pimeloyl-ACP methyl ester carboxylesterase